MMKLPILLDRGTGYTVGVLYLRVAGGVIELIQGVA